MKPKGKTITVEALNGCTVTEEEIPLTNVNTFTKLPFKTKNVDGEVIEVRKILSNSLGNYWEEKIKKEE